MWEWLTGRLEAGNPMRAVGDRGEERAARYLARARRFCIVARNWRSPRDQRDELDLVCRDRDVLVFVEVKSRAPGALVSGYHAVTKRKKTALLRAADAYLKSLARADRPRTFRFDIVEVCSRPELEDADVRHFENVPLFPKHYWP